MGGFQVLPGFRDFYPEDHLWRRHLFDLWRRTAHSYSYSEYDGPVLEDLGLYEAKSGPEIVAQLFNFVDKGERSVSLRPEMTPTLARMVGSRAASLKRPLRWFSIGDHFRYERRQRGRLRAFSQLNADLLGESGPAADAEIIALMIECLACHGLGPEDFRVRLSDRTLWCLWLDGRGCTPEETEKVLRVVDKLEREDDAVSLQKLREILGPRAEDILSGIQQFCAIDSLDQLQSFFGSQGLLALNQVKERLDAWQSLWADLEAMGLGPFLQTDLGIVRGLAYYTGFVFEAFDAKGQLRAIAGGGRYDHLVETLGGPSFPAVGFGMGDVVLSELLAERGKLPTLVAKTDLQIIVSGPDERRTALSYVRQLRQMGLRVDLPLRETGLGRQFKQASASGAALALVFGSDELAHGMVLVKELAGRREQKIALGDLLPWVREQFFPETGTDDPS